MRSLHLLIVALLLFVFAFINQQIGKQLQISQQHKTYSLCLTAHAEVNGASEQACGAAKDRTHTEFLCDKTNAYCWLEIK